MSREHLEQNLIRLIHQDLGIEIPTPDIKLFDEGYIDSLLFIQLLTIIEDRFEITISLEDLDFVKFESVRSIAEFIYKSESDKQIAL